MKKRLYIIIGVIVLVLIVGLLFLFSANKARQPGNSVSNIPDYTLSESQQSYINLLVQIYIEGYNSYGYDNLADLTDTMHNATPALAAQIQKLLTQIQTDSRYRNYRITTTTDPKTFQYRYPQQDQIIATMNATVQEQDNGSTKTYPITATVTLQKQGSDWLLDAITIRKQ